MSDSYYEYVREQEGRVSVLLAGKIRSATVEDYKKWLNGYVSRGKKPTHVYDYKWDGRGWFVATSDFSIAPLHGSSSVRIIVPSGINFLGGSLGHNEIYLMDSYTTVHKCFAPKFIDT